MIVSDYIANYLKEDGISTVFGYQGGNISFTIDAIVRAGLRFVETYNEQGASFAANAYADISNRYGVAVSSSGPGAINMLNGIANAYFDGIPCLFITGDVNTNFRNKYPNVRQSEFQEVDIISISKPIVKKAFQVQNADEIPFILDEAKRIMFDERKGPVLINLAHNIQKAEINYPIHNKENAKSTNTPTITGCEDIIQEKISKAENPVVLIGNGCNDNKKVIREWLDETGLSFTSTLKALDFYPDSPSYLGFAGNYGADKAKKALDIADLILVLGARLDIRVISAISNFKEKVIIHIDIDKDELFKHDSIEYVRFNCNLRDVDFKKIKCKKFINKDLKCTIANFDTLSFRAFFSSFRWNSKATYLLDVGLHQMAAAKFLNLKDGDRILSSGGLGSMGYSLPAAIGSCYADETSIPIVFCGDGGVQMNLQELETIRRDRLPIQVFVLNNSCLGMIRNYQDFALGKRHYATIEGFSSPSYKKLADAYSMKYYKVEEISEMDIVLESLHNDLSASLIEVNIPVNDNID